MPYMCGTGHLTDTGVTSPTFDDGQTDASSTMDVDEDLSDDTMGILQLQMKQPNSNKGPASNMVR
jgi:hypothetical protein